MVAEAKSDIGRPDYFTYYTCAVKDLLSQDDDFLPFAAEITRKSFSEVNDKGTSCGCNGASSAFDNNIGLELSDYKRERLNALLRQTVMVLVPEVDEMLEPVTSIRQLQSHVRSKKFPSNYTGAASERDAAGQVLNKRPKMTSCSSTPSPVASRSNKEVDDDLQFLLENDNSLVEETIKKCSDELFAKLSQMESQLELLLDTVVSTCRCMTRNEQQQLQRLIQKLPPKNLSRVVEIVEHSKPVEKRSSDEIFVDLNQQDNVTLWRLYFYVKAVEKARELAC